MLNLLNKYKIHFYAWVIFILYESLAIGFAVGKFSKLSTYIIFYSLNIGLFYLHANLTLPYALKRGKQWIWRMPFFIFIELIIYLLSVYLADYFLFLYTSTLHDKVISVNMNRILGGIWRGIYFIAFSSAYYFFKTYLKERKINEILEKHALEAIIKEKEMAIELSQAKNAFLRAQINPHFFFNTLNFIYSNTRKSEPVAAKAIVLLSKIMRYAIENEHSQVLIKLSDEIIQTENLIHLSKLRNENNFHIIFNYPTEIRSVCFIPLVLLTLTENMFKHGDLSIENEGAIISLQMKNKTLILETDNLTNTGLYVHGQSMGLENIRQRLLLHYGKKAELISFTKGKRFIVRVMVPIGNLDSN